MCDISNNLPLIHESLSNHITHKLPLEEKSSPRCHQATRSTPAFYSIKSTYCSTPSLHAIHSVPGVPTVHSMCFFRLLSTVLFLIMPPKSLSTPSSHITAQCFCSINICVSLHQTRMPHLFRSAERTIDSNTTDKFYISIGLLTRSYTYKVK